MSGVTIRQSELGTYAEAVLRHDGIKTCRVRWPATDVLSVEVDPTRLEQVQKLLPIIQRRAEDGIRVELHPPDSPDLNISEVAADPFSD